jgi:small GTP-binding protein
MEDEEFEEKCSIIMLGDAGVGKSCISVTYKSGESLNKNVDATIGIDLWTKIARINDTYIKAIIYDTSGQERFRSIPKSYIRKGDGIVIVYDITNK